MLEWMHTLGDFHLLRPWWLLALLPATLLAMLLFHHREQAGRWQTVISAELLPFLLDGKQIQLQQRHFLWALLFWALATIALAGPTWTKIPLPIHKQQQPLVIMLDLSPSMLAEDSKPNRLTRARLKLIDLLNKRREGTTALIAYAHNAHVVTPLTDDNATIISLIPALHPNIMPVAGSRPLSALQKGLEIIMQAGHQNGELLLITDGISNDDVEAMTKLIQNTGPFNLSVLAPGSHAGAPIPTDGGGFLKNRQGEIIVARLDTKPLRQLAQYNNGRYIELSDSDRDLDYLATTIGNLPDTTAQRLERTFDTWQDNGFWLALVMLPLVLMAFRRNLITMLVLAPVLLYSENNHAFEWADLWQTADQQGQQAFTAGDTDTAEERFKNPHWKGAAAYRNEHFDAAQEAFGQDTGAVGKYNLANSQARAGQLEEAIKTYDQALAINPDYEDAAFNRELIEELLKQQEKQQQNQQSSEDNSAQQPPDDNSEQEQNQNQQSSNKDTGDKQQSSSPSDSDSETDSNEDKDPDPQRDEQQQNGDSQDAPTEQQPAPQSAEKDNKESDQQATALNKEADISDEQRQSLEQWLRRVPDDPGGLLRRKFAYEAWLREQRGQEDRNDPEVQRW
ncbi:MAG: hypothetical protein DRR42_14320 [Gammaproteobacteria bacterium]|nr:MAG: hypothetical protein DRR42_14320 [Gammaproteobacteria bacterium]